jgi:anti-sigma regulatory factor (Ser/Thr protein kinase)
MMRRVQRDFPSDLHAVREVREFVCEACRQVWSRASDDAALDAIGLATGEAAANIILHAFRGEPDRSIEVTVAVDDREASVTMKYEGEDFDLRSVPPPDFDRGLESGYGVYLINRSVDEVACSRDEAGRCVMSLIKYRH